MKPVNQPPPLDDGHLARRSALASEEEKQSTSVRLAPRPTPDGASEAMETSADT